MDRSISELGMTTSPAFNAPIYVTYASIKRGTMTRTTSPFLSPLALNTLAALFAAVINSSYVISFFSPCAFT